MAILRGGQRLREPVPFGLPQETLGAWAKRTSTILLQRLGASCHNPSLAPWLAPMDTGARHRATRASSAPRAGHASSRWRPHLSPPRPPHQFLPWSALLRLPPCLRRCSPAWCTWPGSRPCLPPCCPRARPWRGPPPPLPRWPTGQVPFLRLQAPCTCLILRLLSIMERSPPWPLPRARPCPLPCPSRMGREVQVRQGILLLHRPRSPSGLPRSPTGVTSAGTTPTGSPPESTCARSVVACGP